MAVTEAKAPKVNLNYQRDKERQTVKGIFHFYEVPGGSMSFVFKAYKGDDVARYDLIDGGMYTLPLGVAKHLNKNGWYPVHEYAQDEFGKALMRVGKKIRRFGFQSLEFVDVEDLALDSNQIVTVEQIEPNKG